MVQEIEWNWELSGTGLALILNERHTSLCQIKHVKLREYGFG